MPGSSTAITVMVVDDDPQVRHVFAEFLDREYDVVAVDSGEAALRRLDEDVDIVILDRRMPDLSGDEVLERIRGTGSDVPVALVTAVDPDFDILDMGFDDYVVKPVTSDELHHLVDTLVLRAEYDEVMREYFSLVSKAVTLQARKGSQELTSSEAYRDHRELIEEIKGQARDALDSALESGKFDDLIRDLLSDLPDRDRALDRDTGGDRES